MSVWIEGREYVATAEAARMLGLQHQTLVQRRHRARSDRRLTHPPYISVGQETLYRQEDIVAYGNSQ
jgi:hypothetical protein